MAHVHVHVHVHVLHVHPRDAGPRTPGPGPAPDPVLVPYRYRCRHGSGVQKEGVVMMYNCPPAPPSSRERVHRSACYSCTDSCKEGSVVASQPFGYGIAG